MAAIATKERKIVREEEELMNCFRP